MIDSADKFNIEANKAMPYAGEISLMFPKLSCQIQPSKLTCLVGPHRSQLRAYLLMLAGIHLPEDGMVKIFGQKISEFDQLGWQKLRCQVGYLSGSAPLLSAPHGLMNVMLPMLYHTGYSFHETSTKARILLEELNCQFELTTSPSLLNIFQRMQLALARALILEPPILILDLPFNGLGAKEREKMGELLAKLIQKHTICMVGGLQYPHFLEQYAQQIIFISEHKIINFNDWHSFKQADNQEVQELLNVL